jgi:hypothetical protein
MKHPFAYITSNQRDVRCLLYQGDTIFSTVNPSEQILQQAKENEGFIAFSP